MTRRQRRADHRAAIRQLRKQAGCADCPAHVGAIEWHAPTGSWRVLISHEPTCPGIAGAVALPVLIDSTGRLLAESIGTVLIAEPDALPWLLGTEDRP